MNKANESLRYTLNPDFESYSVSGMGTCTDKDVVIPSTYLGKPVTGIGSWAFNNRMSMTSVKIPDSVTSIGEGAFHNCQSLTEITIPDGVTGIASWTFDGCKALTDVTIGKSVTRIEQHAFHACKKLTDIRFSEGVTGISSRAFSDCTGLASITVEEGNSTLHSSGNCLIETSSKTLLLGCKNSVIPTDGSVTSIAELAFNGCISLNSITVPNSVTSIGYQAFGGCNGLTSITLPFVGAAQEGSEHTHFGYIFGAKTPEENSSTVPASLKTVAITEETTIGYHAFYGCNELTNITVVDSVTEISLGAFSGCYRLTNMTLPFVGAAKDSRENTHFGYIFGAKTPETNNSAVPSLKTVVITGETSIGDQAFYLCSGIKSITPPHTLTSIGSGAFQGCISLTSITIPDGVIGIGSRAFNGCTGLESITLPDSVTSIGSGAFEYCTGLREIILPCSVETIGKAALSGCSSLESITVDNRNPVYFSTGNCIIEKSTKLLVAGCKASRIPDDGSVIGIDRLAFYACNSLTDMTIPKGITGIGTGAFQDCTGLVRVTISDSVTSIGASSFRGCTKLTNILIPDSVTDIGYRAFEGCTELTKITLPFAGAKKDDNANTHFGYIFGASNSGANASCVPASLKTVTITGGASIGGYAFRDCIGLTSILIPNSITSIGVSAFENCKSLTGINIPDGVTSIGSCAFESCSSLEYVTLPKSLTAIAPVCSMAVPS